VVGVVHNSEAGKKLTVSVVVAGRSVAWNLIWTLYPFRAPSNGVIDSVVAPVPVTTVPDM
jgi:hypothetical protein